MCRTCCAGSPTPRVDGANSPRWSPNTARRAATVACSTSAIRSPTRPTSPSRCRRPGRPSGPRPRWSCSTSTRTPPSPSAGCSPDCSAAAIPSPPSATPARPSTAGAEHRWRTSTISPPISRRRTAPRRPSTNCRSTSAAAAGCSNSPTPSPNPCAPGTGSSNCAHAPTSPTAARRSSPCTPPGPPRWPGSPAASGPSSMPAPPPGRSPCSSGPAVTSRRCSPRCRPSVCRSRWSA